MRDVRAPHVLAVGAIGVYWTAYEFQVQRALGALPQAVRDVFMSDASVVIGFAGLVLVGVYVGRWWSLVAAGVPIAALGLLQLTGHVAPYHEGGRPLEDWEILILILAIPIGVGVLARKTWERIPWRLNTNQSEAGAQ
jgi:hypothetical protein